MQSSLVFSLEAFRQVGAECGVGVEASSPSPPHPPPPPLASRLSSRAGFCEVLYGAPQVLHGALRSLWGALRSTTVL
eukprot:3275761-Pyramimonas_sp.AAC.1